MQLKLLNTIMQVVAFACLALTLCGVNAKQNKSLNGTTAVVTGGAKGIGYAIAENLLKNGAKTVIIVDINKPRGMEAQDKLNEKYGSHKTVYIFGDITKDLERVWKIIYATCGCVDILVNNAGVVNEYVPKKAIITNALGTALWSHKFYEDMRKDRGGKGGTVINMASESAYFRDPVFWFYKSSKYAILGLTFGMGHEYNYMTSGVRIFAICPGLTYTDMTKQQMVVNEQIDVFTKYKKVAKWQNADAVGKGVAMLYETGITGTAYTIEGGEPPVVSPDRFDVTAEFLLSL